MKLVASAVALIAFAVAASALGAGMREVSVLAVASETEMQDAAPVVALEEFASDNTLLAGSNNILSCLTTSGASAKTAGQDRLGPGVGASRQMAAADLRKCKAGAANILKVAAEYKVPPALLAGIASRESRCGGALEADGTGDHGNGYGWMQVDRRSHKIDRSQGPSGYSNIAQGARVLVGMLKEVKQKHPHWSPAWQLRGAVAAYNAGPGVVGSQNGLDRGTTGDDYSADTWARAQALAPHFGGAPGPCLAAGQQQQQSKQQGQQQQPMQQQKQQQQKQKPAASGVNLNTPQCAARKGQCILRSACASPKTVQTGLCPGSTFCCVPPSTGTTTPTGTTTNGVNLNHPWLRKLATSPLNNGPDGSCVATTLGNMDRLGIPSFQGGTTADPNNSRGAMVLLIKNGKWTSLPLPGSKLTTISGAYGTVQAHVIGADPYEVMAKAGKIPSGSLIFQTRHGWTYGGGASGNDMGIVRNGGRVTHNYRSMPPIIYSNAKQVVILVPK